MADSDILGTQNMLCQELDQIEERRRRRCSAPQFEPVDGAELETRAQRLKLNALCLSGGGIRSAAFCLGVLQALAEKRLLGRFDYLSTVSGGGFIGGWLQILIRECGGVDRAEAAIDQARPEALRRLRAYTNYLTPQTGPLSVDTWAGIVLYLRNLLINWAVFAPLFLLLALIPIVYRTAIDLCSHVAWVNLALLSSASVALLVAVIRSCSLLPSHRERTDAAHHVPSYASVASIRWTIVCPAFAWTLLVPWLLDFSTVQRTANTWLEYNVRWVVPVIYLALMTVGFRLAWWLQSRRNDPGVELFRTNFRRWMMASFGSAMLTWFMLSIAISILPLARGVDTAAALSVFGPLALAVVYVLQTSLYVALRRETELADLDREWLGRINAMILRLAAGWTLLALSCLIPQMLVGPDEPNSIGTTWSGGGISVMGAITMLIGGAAAWLGKIWPSVETLAARPMVRDKVRAYLPTVLGALFAGCLLALFGGVLHFMVAQLQTRLGAAIGQRAWLPLVLELLIALILFVGVMKFRRVNVNRFSMHAVYRNRLTRAFLGSARNARQQDPFTGFDPQDNTPLTSLLDNAGSLFPVINTTLNITAGNNTAWAERKAASFTATPLACGSAALRHPGQASSEIDPRGAFVPTNRFAGMETLVGHPAKPEESGTGLGNALTVSGAAVSPSWGYHSSRVTAFIMTLFNMRLGVWLPNPSKASADELRLARPRNSLMALIDEMLGKTTDDSQAIYLSDGGHFENLGLYEMLRRRCSSILVVDAGADEACTLFDLGNAIRKAEIDLGIFIRMDEPMQVFARARLDSESAPMADARGYAFGDIDYGGGHVGRLLYVKPSFLAGIPVDVRSYGAEHKAFPHESTLDQWFTESQFESYRMLGRYQMTGLVGNVGRGELSALFATTQAVAQSPPPDDTEDEVIAGRIGPAPGGSESAAAD